MAGSALPISDLSRIFDRAIEPIDRIYFASYNPIVQIGFVVTSTTVITWAYLRRSGWKRLAWMAVGSIPLLILLARNLTADRQRRGFNRRMDRYVDTTQRINRIFEDIPDLDGPSDSDTWAESNS